MAVENHSGSVIITEPPKRPWRKVALSALAVAVIAGTVVAWQWPRLNGAPAPLVTDGSYLFDPGSTAMASVEGAIATENAHVRTDGIPYVSVALLDPFTYTPGSDVSLTRMVDEMRGAYLAQSAINAKQVLGVQLLLASEGSSTEEQQGAAVRQLQGLQGAPDHLVAVAGMGISIVNSEDAARSLAADQMAAFGALPTADQFSSLSFRGFDQVTPNVSAQVRVLRDVLPAPANAVLVRDQQATDLYTSDVEADLSRAYGGRTHLHDYPFTPGTSYTNEEFELIAANACDQPGKASPAVFYAGRASVLQALITQFQQATDCAGKAVTIVTAGDADGLPATATRTPATAAGAQVSVEYSDIVNLNKLTSAFTASYQGYLAAADKGLSGLADAWTIATYDSVTAAWAAIDAAYHGSAPSLPTRQDVEGLTGLLNGKYAPAGATGTGTFDLSSYGQLLSPDIPVFLDSGGARTTIRP
jgi:hypothetical protein